MSLAFVMIWQTQSVQIIVGSHVWVEDPVLAWLAGEVTSISGQDVHVRTTKGKMVSASSCSRF